MSEQIILRDPDRAGADFHDAAMGIETYAQMVKETETEVGRVQEAVDGARDALNRRKQELTEEYESCNGQEDSEEAQEEKRRLQQQLQEVEQKLQMVQRLEQQLQTVLMNLQRQRTKCEEGAGNGRELAAKVDRLMQKYKDAKEGS